jgi:hypothetical protein
MAVRYVIRGAGPLDVIVEQERGKWWVRNLPYVVVRRGLSLDERGLRSYPTADAAFAALAAARKETT